MALGDAEAGLLEDCFEDWRALWEIPAGPPTSSIAESVAFLMPLIEDGYLTTLAVTAWEQARARLRTLLQACTICSSEGERDEESVGRVTDGGDEAQASGGAGEV